MCGIIAYAGKDEARDILLDGLRALEYRGYDSSGLFIHGAGRFRAEGRIANLAAKVGAKVSGHSGIAHTRWATHGVPSERNAHPHADEKEETFVVHNGIIENHIELRKRLERAGHTFSSDTDTEVIAHLFEEGFARSGDLEQAFVSTLRELKGTFGLALTHVSDPDLILAARMGSPVAIGIAPHGIIIASDPFPILKHTQKIVFLSDGEICKVSPSGYAVYDFKLGRLDREPETFDGVYEVAGKGTYEHFMEKEIYEIPAAIRNVLAGRLIPGKGEVKLGGLEAAAHILKKARFVTIVGCGTALHSGMLGRHFIEEHAGIPAVAEAGSEFRYRSQVMPDDSLLIAVSQSGETADTLEAVREAKRRGIFTIGVVNVVGSTIAREVDAGVYTHSGQEIAVASTKAFVSQTVALLLIALFLGRQRGLSEEDASEIIRDLSSLAAKAEEVLADVSDIRSIAERYSGYRNFLFMGRRFSVPIAFEGALKLKEVSYIHAEGCPAGEMKHGTLAMIDADFPTVAIATKDSTYEKMMSNIHELKARKGKVIAIASRGNESVAAVADETIVIPDAGPTLTSLLAVVPLHFFAYAVARTRGFDPDKPRNLAKSVTVE
jgi:glucosamine--fructose-6-phosphate aminotransferase (isomerizing)